MKIILIISFLFQISIHSEECVAKNSFAFVELFTSEGCSSCPPAESILNKLSTLEKSKNVFPVAFHVDYWDYIGWKDNYAKREYSDRQRTYADKFRSNQVYTPQVIINGKHDISGSDENSILNEINLELQKKSEINLSITHKMQNDKILLSYKISCSKTPMNLQILLVQKGIQTKVLSGENKNKSLKHENVVIFSKSIQNAPKSGTQEIPFKITKPENAELIIFLQNESSYEVTGIQSTMLNKSP